MREWLPGVRTLATPGHTRGHQSILIEDQGQGLLFAGDLLPLYRHGVIHFNMAYDIDPWIKMKTKREVLLQAVDRDLILALCHEPKEKLCRVVYHAAKDRFELQSIC